MLCIPGLGGEAGVADGALVSSGGVSRGAQGLGTVKHAGEKAKGQQHKHRSAGDMELPDTSEHHRGRSMLAAKRYHRMECYMLTSEAGEC